MAFHSLAKLAEVKSLEIVCFNPHKGISCFLSIFLFTYIKDFSVPTLGKAATGLLKRGFWEV